MVRIVAAVVALLLLLPSTLAGAVKDSVYPLQWDGDEVCTTFSIHQEKGYWITARHCLPALYEEHAGAMMRIKGVLATVEIENETHDAVVLKSAFHAKALRLSPHPPKAPECNGISGAQEECKNNGEKLSIYGYPDGYRKFTGRYLGFYQYGMDPTKWGLYSALVEKGTSGGPVIGDDGVIGLLNFSLYTSQGRTHSGGTPWEVLHQLVALGYWDPDA